VIVWLGEHHRQACSPEIRRAGIYGPHRGMDGRLVTFFIGVDFGLKNKMTAALYLVANRSLVTGAGPFLAATDGKLQQTECRSSIEAKARTKTRPASYCCRASGVVEIMNAIAAPADPAVVAPSRRSSPRLEPPVVPASARNWHNQSPAKGRFGAVTTPVTTPRKANPIRQWRDNAALWITGLNGRWHRDMPRRFRGPGRVPAPSAYSPAPSACLQPERICSAVLTGLDISLRTLSRRPGSIGGRARVRKACIFFDRKPLPRLTFLFRRVQPLQGQEKRDFRTSLHRSRQSCTTRSQL